MRAGGVFVTTRTTVQRANFREIPRIIEVGLAADVNALSFLAVDVSNEFAFGNRFNAPAHVHAEDDDQHMHLPVLNGAMQAAESNALTPDEVDERTPEQNAAVAKYYRGIAPLLDDIFSSPA